MVQTTSYSLDSISGKGIQVWENNTEKLTAQVDLRAFYKELFKNLINSDFIDGSSIEGKAAGMQDDIAMKNQDTEVFGVLTNQSPDSFDKAVGSRRHNGMFEVKHRCVKLPNTTFHDFETTWFFRKKTPVLGWWFNFKMDIACRNYENVEIEKNGSKKTIQKGTWEFRNTAFMTPERDQLEAIRKKTQFLKPLVSQKRLENIYLNHIMFDDIEYDVNWCKNNGNGAVYNILNKYFKGS